MGYNLHNAIAFDSTTTNLYLTLILSVSGSGQFTNLCKAPVSDLSTLQCHALSPTGFGDYVKQFTIDSNNKLYLTGMFFRDTTTFWVLSSAKINLNTGNSEWQMQYDDSLATTQGMNIDSVVTYLSDDLMTLYYGVSLTTSENYFFYCETTGGTLLNSFKENTSGKFLFFANFYRNLITINFHDGTDQVYILLENSITYFTISTQAMSGDYFQIAGFLRTFGYFLAQNQ